jgi:hypothetical protein
MKTLPPSLSKTSTAQAQVNHNDRQLNQAIPITQHTIYHIASTNGSPPQAIHADAFQHRAALYASIFQVHFERPPSDWSTFSVQQVSRACDAVQYAHAAVFVSPAFFSASHYQVGEGIRR